MKRIVIVEDEVKLAQVLADYVKHSGYEPVVFHEGSGVPEWVNRHRPDFLLLDIMVPGLDGLEICKAVRQFSNVPIMMVTARVDEIDRLLGLELGADDYICKPYSPREVIARIKAILRRAQPQARPETPVKATTLLLDEDTLCAIYLNQSIAFTHIEFKLLSTLVSHPGRIFNRQQLMNTIYDDQRVVSDRTIDSHIKKIRKKIEAVNQEPVLIHSIYGAGYTYKE